MASARDEEIRGRRIAVASEFDCPYCIRMEDLRYVMSADEEDMHPADRLEAYNQRRYRHYFNDFGKAQELRDHLHARCRYWVPQGGAELDSAIIGTESTMAWWEHAVSVRIAEAKKARANLH